MFFFFKDDAATMMEVDHELKQVYKEQMKVLPQEEIPTLHKTAEAVSARLTSPIVTTYVDTDKINFERNKTGIWGWRSDKTERVVFTLFTLNFVFLVDLNYTVVTGRLLFMQGILRNERTVDNQN